MATWIISLVGLALSCLRHSCTGSLGAIGPLSRALLKDLGRRIKESTGEARAHEYLVQRLAVAVQRGNAVSIMGTMGDPGQDFFG